MAKSKTINPAVPIPNGGGMSRKEELATMLAVGELHKDLFQALGSFTNDQARFLVDLYYQLQKFRLKLEGQIRSQKKIKESVEILEWFHTQFVILETQAKNALERYAKTTQASRWALGVMGIKGVIASGLVAYIKVDRDNPNPKKRLNNASKLQRYAGLDPTCVWAKGEKRPWNAKLKKLCYILGESFVKQQGRENAFYSDLFTEFKNEEVERNDAGKNRKQAIKDAGKYGKATDAWKWVNGCFRNGICKVLQEIPKRLPEEILEIEDSKERNAAKKAWTKEQREIVFEEYGCKPGEGDPMLPASQVHGRARRRVVKIFLVHMWEEIWVEKYGEEPPVPWLFVHGGHSDRIYRPNPSMITSVPPPGN